MNVGPTPNANLIAAIQKLNDNLIDAIGRMEVAQARTNELLATLLEATKEKGR